MTLLALTKLKSDLFDFLVLENQIVFWSVYTLYKPYNKNTKSKIYDFLFSNGFFNICVKLEQVEIK